MGGTSSRQCEAETAAVQEANIEIGAKNEEVRQDEIGPRDEAEEERLTRKRRQSAEMEDFKASLDLKRERRRIALQRIAETMNELRRNNEELENERTLRLGLERQVSALKEVSTVSNEMLQLREAQVVDLKKKLEDIEATAEENLQEIREQYERQIDNIRKLRQLYEERAAAATRGHERELEKERAKATLLELKLEDGAKMIALKGELEVRVASLELRVAQREDEIRKLKALKTSLAAECRNATAQLTLINNLFSNLLVGNDLNLDLLTRLLQDNHHLISDLITNGDMNDTVALLVDIAEKAYKVEGVVVERNEDVRLEIATNLPKVWKVLIELLSRHEDKVRVEGVTAEECYTSVKTASGSSRNVISVSQTFLRLKDLILEKNSLVKEVKRLRTLNGHLETRLDSQEKRLSHVCSELRKTWGVVSKLKVQHRQLHTHEKILRYELQQKRYMLTELKQELEYCRETWDRAREKNTQTEHDWQVLRKEFAARKARDSNESGYEDDESSLDVSLDEDKTSEEESPDVELEDDGDSDATVIELMDMLEEAEGIRMEQVDELEEVEVELEVESEVEMATESSETISNVEDIVASTDVEEIVAEREESTEILTPREARLRRLETQCRSLLNQMALTSFRSDTLSTRLEELHEQYGGDRRSNARSSGNSEHLEISTMGPSIEIDNSASDLSISDLSSPEATTNSMTTSVHSLSTGCEEESRASRLLKMEQSCLKLFEQGSAAQCEELTGFEPGAPEGTPETPEKATETAKEAPGVPEEAPETSEEAFGTSGKAPEVPAEAPEKMQLNLTSEEETG